jgi:hypothetical protein
MQSVEYVHGWWVLGACGRNPLVRGVDRLELFIVALGIFVALAATACAGALGTAVHDARSRVYVEQAQTRHTVTARATTDSTIVVRVDDSTATTTNARWQVDGTEHTGSFTLDHAVKTGDPLTIWVDRHGDRVDAPAPTSQAGVDAVGVAYAAWQAMALAVTGLVRWGRSHLDGRRDSAWEHDIRCLVDDDEWRTRRKS